MHPTAVHQFSTPLLPWVGSCRFVTLGPGGSGTRYYDQKCMQWRVAIGTLLGVAVGFYTQRMMK
jgi:hypothetical protein